MRNGGYIGVRADKALRLLGEKGPMRMSALLCALGLRPQCSSFKYTVSKLVDAKILKVTGSADPIVSLADQAYADPACAREVYEAYNSEKKAEKEAEKKTEKKTETKAVIIPPVKRSMIENIAFGMAEQGVKA